MLLNGLTDMHPKDPFDWGAVEYEILEMSDVRIAEWAIEALGKNYDQPFFLGVGFHFPHLPWYLPRVHLERYPVKSVVLPVVREDDLDDVPPEGRKIAWWTPRARTNDYEGSDHRKVLDAGAWKSAVQAYSAASTFVDDQLGRVLEALGNSAHADNTIVVAFADNGWHLASLVEPRSAVRRGSRAMAPSHDPSHSRRPVPVSGAGVPSSAPPACRETISNPISPEPCFPGPRDPRAPYRTPSRCGTRC